MVCEDEFIYTPSGNIFPIKQICELWGFTTCRVCKEQYVGQTITNFLNVGLAIDTYGNNLEPALPDPIEPNLMMNQQRSLTI